MVMSFVSSCLCRFHSVYFIGGYQGGYQGPQAWSQPGPAAAAAAPSTGGSYNRDYSFKSQMRCNNCGERGHFSKECPRGPLPSFPK